MKKTLQPHLLKRVAPACKGERTMRWRGRPPIGGQGSDRVSHRCSAPYTLLPLRGISPQGETRTLRRKTESHILHVPLRHSPFGGWRHHLSAPLGSVSLDSQTSGRIAKGRRLYGQARRQLIRPCVFYAEYAPTAPCESFDTLSRGESPAQPDKGEPRSG